MRSSDRHAPRAAAEHPRRRTGVASLGAGVPGDTAGGGIAVALRKAGVVGLIVDGPCADPAELEDSGLSIWSRGITALTTRTYGIGGSMNQAVSIGGAVAMPGDLVIADRGGIVFIPANEAAAAVETAIAYQQREALLFPQIGGKVPLGRLTGASDMVERVLALVVTEVQSRRADPFKK